MKVLLASSSLVAEPSLRALLSSRHEVVGGLTTPDRPRGRGREITENEFAQLLSVENIPVYKPQSSAELIEILTKVKPDVVITISYGRLIKLDALRLPKFGWLNVHFSLLPRWRGASPIQRAIAAGDTSTGVTVFKIEEGLDTGPIYVQREYVMRGNEQTAELLDLLSHEATTSLIESLQMIEDGVEPTPQSESGVTLAPKITKEEGRIDWHFTNEEIERQIRALSPWPSAWSLFSGQRIAIISAKLSSFDLRPGEILSADGIHVGCGKDSLQIVEIKPEGKRTMLASEWLRGLRHGTEMGFE